MSERTRYGHVAHHPGGTAFSDERTNQMRPRRSSPRDRRRRRSPPLGDRITEQQRLRHRGQRHDQCVHQGDQAGEQPQRDARLPPRAAAARRQPPDTSTSRLNSPMMIARCATSGPCTNSALRRSATSTIEILGHHGLGHELEANEQPDGERDADHGDQQPERRSRSTRRSRPRGRRRATTPVEPPRHRRHPSPRPSSS